MRLAYTIQITPLGGVGSYQRMNRNDQVQANREHNHLIIVRSFGNGVMVVVVVLCALIKIMKGVLFYKKWMTK